MTMYNNPWMMNPMGGGMNYWNPQRMQNAQGMGAYNSEAGAATQGGADRPGYEWRASRREGMDQRGGLENKVGRATDRLGMMQERFKAASSNQQRAMQPRMDNMQARIDRWQGKLDEGQGADRLGMGWRKERRQAKNDGNYDPNAQQDGGYGGMNNMGEMAWFGGGMMPGMGGMGMGGMGYGGYGGFPQMFGGMPQMQASMMEAPQAQGGPTPVAPYNPQAPAPQPQGQSGWNPATQATGIGNMFDTSFGRLVPSSTGNQNVFQREGDQSMLYHFDPTQGWKTMTPDAYRGYGEYNYQDPRQFGAAANPMMQNWTQKNGMWQGMQGTGAYA